ncbi:hypothetical protein IMY05_C4641000100 [Salix suchowensis]|nr:hypothetical protein IMY05_C4641000100 [Salix suchowensis]
MGDVNYPGLLQPTQNATPHRQYKGVSRIVGNCKHLSNIQATCVGINQIHQVYYPTWRDQRMINFGKIFITWDGEQGGMLMLTGDIETPSSSGRSSTFTADDERSFCRLNCSALDVNTVDVVRVEYGTYCRCSLLQPGWSHIELVVDKAFIRGYVDDAAILRCMHIFFKFEVVNVELATLFCDHAIDLQNDMLVAKMSFGYWGWQTAVYEQLAKGWACNQCQWVIFLIRFTPSLFDHATSDICIRLTRSSLEIGDGERGHVGVSSSLNSRGPNFAMGTMGKRECKLLGIGRRNVNKYIVKQLETLEERLAKYVAKTSEFIPMPFAKSLKSL